VAGIASAAANNTPPIKFNFISVSSQVSISADEKRDQLFDSA
jgi:hypothetical protein